LRSRARSIRPSPRAAMPCSRPARNWSSPPTTSLQN
jgi:hypothetical protein